jgi:hypothetical protein
MIPSQRALPTRSKQEPMISTLEPLQFLSIAAIATADDFAPTEDRSGSDGGLLDADIHGDLDALR